MYNGKINISQRLVQPLGYLIEHKDVSQSVVSVVYGPAGKGGRCKLQSQVGEVGRPVFQIKFMESVFAIAIAPKLFCFRFQMHDFQVAKIIF